MAKKPTKDTGAEKAEGIALDFGGEPPAQAAPEAPQGEQAQAPLTILGQYTRDLSFEAPGAPQIFGELENNPSIEISVDVQTRHLGDQAHECSLHFTVNGTFNGKPGFVLELVYGAACILNVPQEHIQGVLHVDVARILFPFARSIISDLTRDSGFPALLIQPIDFMQVYQQRMAQAQAQQDGKAN